MSKINDWSLDTTNRYPKHAIIFGLIPAYYFVFDGWFGIDKVGHFTRHFVATLIGSALGAAGWAIVFYDTFWDGLYEHKDYCAGHGFSLNDFCYGRLGMVVALLVIWIRAMLH